MVPSKPVKTFYILLLFLSIGFQSCDKKSGGTTTPPPPPPPTANTFTNPILTSGPDPWVIKKDNFYYYTHTLGNRIALWKTEKMTELRNATSVTVWNAPASGANSKNVWAPELHYLNSKWYIYYTAGSNNADLSTQRSFVLENANADPLSGTWVDKGKIFDPAADFFAIDGTVFTHNGNNYFLWSGQASSFDNTQRIYIAKMSNPWTLETSRSLISSPEYGWEMIGTPPAVNEGPEILVGPTGKIFLIFSASGCWTDDYALGRMTLTTGADPMLAASWTKLPIPIFTKSPTAFGPGHNTFFKSKDGTEDWILYHANSTSGAGCGDARSPRMQKISWNGDGTPTFGTPVSTSTALTKPSGE